MLFRSETGEIKDGPTVSENLTVPAPEPSPTTTKPEQAPQEGKQVIEEIFPEGMATPEQQQEIIRLGKLLGGFRDDNHIITAVCTRLNIDEWINAQALEVAKIISEWSGVVAQRQSAAKKGEKK